MKILFDETFEDFEIGEFPYDLAHSALGEYHHIMPKGYTGNFYDPINNHQWRSMDGSWLIVSLDNKKYLEQNRGYNVKGHFSDLTSILVLKSHELKQFSVETEFTLYSTEHETGVAFGYVHSRKYYGLVFGEYYIEMFKKDQLTRTSIKRVPFQTRALETYKVVVEKLNGKIVVVINDVAIMEIDEISCAGKIAVISQNACRYDYLKVLVTEEALRELGNEMITKERLLEQKSQQFSKLVLVNKIDLKGKGSGRQIRIANTNGTTIFVFAQHQKRMYRDSFAHISALTVFDITGKILWSFGETNNSLDYGPISCDLPFQIGDINNDSKLELVYAYNFEIYIVDLLTGTILKKYKTPYVKNIDTMEENYPYDYLNVDAIRFADFTKKGYQGDLMVKDRYRNIWGLDVDGDILFKYHHKNTGHFPYVYDFDSDGIDELFIGYDLVKNGKVIWSLPYNNDHTDEIIYEALDDSPEKVFLLASGNEGFNIVDKKGNIIHSIPVGHAQRISLAKYDTKKDGYQICVTSFWGANGIIYVFDKNAKLLAEKEFIGNGNIITPVNYDNDYQNLMLMNTSCEYGGLFDAKLDCVVGFPDDGHPTLASEAFDVDSDGVDEILTWDMNSLWIYKAKHVKPKKIDYRRYPENSFSNYRGEFLLPKDIKITK